MSNERSMLGRPTEPSAVNHFVDREVESEAVAEALLEHVARCDTKSVRESVFVNAMSFYGIGGIGKSELSRNLERWLIGAHAPAGWGSPPPVERLHAIRWELNDSQGNLDVVPLLMAVRSALHSHKPTWPAFDLAFAAYFTSVRPGEEVPLTGLSDTRFADGIVSILGDIAEDLQHSNVAIGLTSSTVRTLVRAAKSANTNWRATRTNPEIAAVLDQCLSEPSPGNQVPHLAADLLWQLTLEIDAMQPSQRPNVAIFIDHFERVQNASRGTGEATLNRFITSLPYAFFVITGRNIVDWYLPSRVDLPRSGRKTWPGLVPGSAEVARQHLLGHLSDDDTRALFKRRREVEGFNLPDAVIEELVGSTGGWPVHIDVVATYARRLSEDDPSHVLTTAELGGSLNVVVANLLDDLPDDERRVFQAACALPFFDVPLVRAVAGSVDDGAVQRCISRALVLENVGSRFPYRVHDVIRAAVRSASAHLSAGWSSEDWGEAAMRALAYAQELFEQAERGDDEQAQFFAVALGINLASENALDPTWIAQAINTGPVITGLRPYIPSSDKLKPDNALLPTIKFIEALDNADVEESVEELAGLRGDPYIGTQAGLWRAYRLRFPLYRHDEAIDVFRELQISNPRRINLYSRQIAVTLSQSRRFKDALAAAGNLDVGPSKVIRDSVERIQGDLRSIDSLRERAESPEHSKRYRNELMGTWLVARARQGQASPGEIAELLDRARSIGNRSVERDALKATGYLELFRTKAFDDVLDGLLQLRRGRSESPAHAELLVLRGMATTRSEFVDQSFALGAELPFRSSAWIPTEAFLESMGRPLPEVQTQWVDKREVVHARWLDIARKIIDRAGDRA